MSSISALSAALGSTDLPVTEEQCTPEAVEAQLAIVQPKSQRDARALFPSVRTLPHGCLHQRVTVRSICGLHKYNAGHTTGKTQFGGRPGGPASLYPMHPLELVYAEGMELPCTIPLERPWRFLSR
jgi:hypothetical protein